MKRTKPALLFPLGLFDLLPPHRASAPLIRSLERCHHGPKEAGNSPHFSLSFPAGWVTLKRRTNGSILKRFGWRLGSTVRLRHCPDTIFTAHCLLTEPLESQKRLQAVALSPDDFPSLSTLSTTGSFARVELVRPSSSLSTNPRATGAVYVAKTVDRRWAFRMREVRFPLFFP
jgi:hypothetical protein